MSAYKSCLMSIKQIVFDVNQILSSSGIKYWHDKENAYVAIKIFS